MTHSTYRASLIGLGFVGAGDQIAGDRIGQQVRSLDGTHLEAIMRNPRVELVAGCDVLEDRRDRFVERTGVTCYSDWRELLNVERPEIVSVATYSPSHAEITVACAESGVKAVYCEKPIATRVVDAERAVAACRDAQALFVVNHNRRFNPNFRRLRDLVTSGGLGELTSCNLQWAAGRLGNVGTHFFDAIEMLTGRRIEAVCGTLDPTGRPDCRGPEFRDPGGWGLLRLEGGLTVTVDAADEAVLPGMMTVNGTLGRAITERGEVTLRLNDGREEHWSDTRAKSTSMDYAMREIVEALDSGDGFSYSPEIAVRVLEAIVAFHVSHERDAAWVALPLSSTDRRREVRIG